MTVRLARIDDRLVHGQIVHGWMPRLGADAILVADTWLAEHEEEQLVLRLIVPEEIEVVFLSPAAVASHLPSLGTRSVLVLFRTPLAALDAVRAGFRPGAINLGNLHFEPGKRQLRKTFCCDERELSALREILAAGVAVEYQPAPELKRAVIDTQELGSGS